MQRQISAGLGTWRTVALLVAALMLGSCASTEKNAWVERRSDATAAGPMVQITGTVVAVSGTVNYRERIALPPDAVVEVQLLDVSRQDAPATIVAAASLSTHGRQVPIPFTLAYDPAKIVEKYIYAVRAVISSEGAMVFTTTSHYPVITRGNPSRVDLMLERVGKTKAHTEKRWGSAWILEDLAGVGVVDRVQATLVFSKDGAVSGNASCNQFRGTVTATSDSLTFSPLATTRKMCAEAVMHQETRYLEALRGANSFEVKGEFLHIHAAGRSRPLSFIEAPSIARATEAPAAAKSVASSPELLGIWTVVGHHIPGISAMSDADAKAWHRRTVRLTAKQAISPESHCDEPAYTTDSVTKDRFLGREFNLPPGSLTPLASLEHITVLQVFCGHGHWTAMGGRMIGIEKDRVLAFWNGVFFELARDRDFRAVGQEPFWRLELHKGKELRFTYDLGKREAATPAPVPANVLATGTSVYHAVTEANDLRVVIEATRCTDVMSGRPFEKTVTVTLNRQTYHGCGESVE